MTSMSVDPFSYDPLPDGHTRLLKFTHSYGGIVCFTLQVFPLANLPKYDALSYAWGSEPQATVIGCNNKFYPLTPHLRAALEAFVVHRDWATRIWVDAICINQEDEEEKASQVKQMKSIYSLAQTVLVWLGKAADSSDLVINERWLLNTAQGLENIPYEVGVSQDTLLVAHGLPGKNDLRWRVLKDIFTRDWWYRLWVVQEVAVAQELLVLCGGHKVKFEALMYCFMMASSRGMLGRSSLESIDEHAQGEALQHAGLLTIVRAAYQEGTLKLQTIMGAMRMKRCKNRVDRVYGLLGLAPQRVQDAIHIDYSLEDSSYWRPYVDFAACAVEIEPSAVLCISGSFGDLPPGMPSWCPKFAATYNDNFLASRAFEAGYIEGEGEDMKMTILPAESISIADPERPQISIKKPAQPFARLRRFISRASQSGQESQPKTIHQPKSLVESGPRLKISGFRISKIENVIRLDWPYPKPGNTLLGQREDHRKTRDLEDTCLKMAQKAYRAKSDEIPDAHWRALIGDKRINFTSPDISSAAPQMRDKYAKFREFFQGSSWKTYEKIGPLAQQLHVEMLICRG